MKKILAVILALVLACAALVTASAAENGPMYFRLDGVEGSAKDAAHEKWIDVTDCTVQTDDDGHVTGFTFTHHIDPATTDILKAYMSGRWFRSAQMEICQCAAGKQHTVRTIRMEMLKITDVEVFETADGSVAETVTLTVQTGSITDTPIE